LLTLGLSILGFIQYSVGISIAKSLSGINEHRLAISKQNHYFVREISLRNHCLPWAISLQFHSILGRDFNREIIDSAGKYPREISFVVSIAVSFNTQQGLRIPIAKSLLTVTHTCTLAQESGFRQTQGYARVLVEDTCHGMLRWMTPFLEWSFNVWPLPGVHDIKVKSFMYSYFEVSTMICTKAYFNRLLIQKGTKT
jgi:hypothetical protein